MKLNFQGVDSTHCQATYTTHTYYWFKAFHDMLQCVVSFLPWPVLKMVCFLCHYILCMFNKLLFDMIISAKGAWLPFGWWSKHREDENQLLSFSSSYSVGSVLNTISDMQGLWLNTFRVKMHNNLKNTVKMYIFFNIVYNSWLQCFMYWPAILIFFLFCHCLDYKYKIFSLCMQV